MMKSIKILASLIVGIAIVMCAAEKPASAISVELAKKCRALMLKAHPYKLPGTGPGSAQAQRSYFSECIGTGGNMPSPPSSAGQNTGANSPASSPPSAGQHNGGR